MQWMKRKDQDGESYYVESRGRYMIDKKVTDDREIDGGYLTTMWTLHEYDPGCHYEPGASDSGFSPVQMCGTLKEAKSSVAADH